MGVKQIIKSECDVIADGPVRIPFDFSDLSSLPKGKKVGDSIVLSPLKTRTWYKLKPLLLSIEKEDAEKLLSRKNGEFHLEAMAVAAKYDELLLDVVCIGIHNKKGDPPRWFREVLKDNTTWEDIYILLHVLFFRLFHNPFSNSITLLRNVSPLDEEEMIALRNNLAMWTAR
ncbi:MAG: hypothetical protein LIP00_12505 [Parabacteroides sp.]|nr:hypothetical protein [Parabacteroides sp.]